MNEQEYDRQFETRWPESEKLAKVIEEVRAAQDFIDWLIWEKGFKSQDFAGLAHEGNLRQLIYEWQDIDVFKVYLEHDQMLEEFFEDNKRGLPEEFTEEGRDRPEEFTEEGKKERR